MLSDADRAGLSDILANIDLADSFVSSLTYEDFVANMQAFYAVTRCLEIISEASRRLSAELKLRHPDIPWKKVAGSGNVYRHNYEDVLQRLFWGTVKEFLPSLREMARKELAPGGPDAA